MTESTTGVTPELIARITRAVYDRLAPLLDQTRVVIGVSNHHVHLSQEDLCQLFGLDEFEVYKPVRQPGEFAAVQKVTVHGPRATFQDVRCMGPCRKLSQVELSLTDCHTLGIEAPITQSGHLDQATWIDIEGPRGTIRRQAAMVAARHLHMGPSHAEALGLHDQDVVRIEIGGVRGGVLDNVIVRTKDVWVPEIHLDLDEANALGVATGDYGRIVVG